MFYRAISHDSNISDGAKPALSPKEIGSTEFFAQSLIHSPNEHFVTIVGEGEYITWQNKSFGNDISFTWSPDSKTQSQGTGIQGFEGEKQYWDLVGRCSVWRDLGWGSGG